MVLPEDSEIKPRRYPREILEEDFGSISPIERFKQWMAAEQSDGAIEPDAFVLSTFDGSKVNARTVALRGITDSGFLIYTNYHSRKAKEIENFPQVAMTFYFARTFRQIRIRGIATKVSKEQSDLYFSTRPRGSQVGAWVSRQSERLSSRDELLDVYKQFDNELGEKVDRPPFWGGYEIVAQEYEFMQAHENRLHDRFRFEVLSQNKFRCERLWP